MVKIIIIIEQLICLKLLFYPKKIKSEEEGETPQCRSLTEQDGSEGETHEATNIPTGKH